LGGKTCPALKCRAINPPEKSGGGPPQSKTLARGTKRLTNAKRLGLRQPLGALGAARK